MALSEEDKQWISGHLGNERQWIGNQLDTLSGRLDGVSGRLDGVSDRLDGVSDRLDGVRQWVSDRLEQVETKLLTAFHNWASPSEMQQRSHRLAINALDSEVELLKDKVKELEGGKRKFLTRGDRVLF